MIVALDITHRQDNGNWAFSVTLPETLYPHGDAFQGVGKGRNWSTYGEFDQPALKATSPVLLLRKIAAHYNYTGPAEVTQENGSTQRFEIS